LGRSWENFGWRGKWEFLRGSPVSGVSVIFETAVMASQTGQRDRGVRGIPGVVADRGAGAARDGRRPERRRCRRDSRHARRGEKNQPGFRKGG
jgi:hypothetical protein